VSTRVPVGPEDDPAEGRAPAAPESWLLLPDGTRLARRSALRFAASGAGGPGGQHVDRSSTKVELRLPLAELLLDDGQRARVATKLARRVTADAELRVTASARRSQVRNRRAAESRLVELVAEALRDDARRIPTRPSAGTRAAMQAERERSQARRRERSWRGEP